MDRRHFLQTMATHTVAATALGLAAGCTAGPMGLALPTPQAIAQDKALPELDWQMPTSWPTGLDTIAGSVDAFVGRVSQMSAGKFRITPHAAGELVPATDIFDAISDGKAPIGHTASFYYISKSNAVAFGTAIPFGLTAQQQNAWFYDGGGLPMLQALYADRFNMIQFPAGNTGAQMGGWFQREINTVVDLRGLKMRIAGLGGLVMRKLGVTVKSLPGSEIAQALQDGTVEAAEWVGPYDDEKLGLNKAAQYYYYPGWWEPGASLEVEINLDEWKALPPEYQEIIQVAAYEANMLMQARYEGRNGAALTRLVQGGTQLRRYSDEILMAAQQASFELFDDFASADADFKNIYDQWLAFRNQSYAWNQINESSFTNFVYGQIK